MKEKFEWFETGDSARTGFGFMSYSSDYSTRSLFAIFWTEDNCLEIDLLYISFTIKIR